MHHVALVDDHILIRQGLAALINSFAQYKVILEADNGRDFIKKLKPVQLPDIVLMDINMPEMDGYATCHWLHVNYPQVKTLAVTVLDDEAAIIRMLKKGAKGYLLKNTDPQELHTAMDEIIKKGYFFNDMVSNRVISSMNHGDDPQAAAHNVLHLLTDRELDFLRHTVSDLSYQQIADKMCLSRRTVESYRDILFQKLSVKTRTGMVLYAIKHKLVEV